VAVQDRKEREFKRREQDILEAALTLFQGDHWQTVTVEQIAQQAEIGKGTVYKHFTSKDEIYARLALDFHRGLLEELRQVDAKLPVLTRLRAMLRILWSKHLRGREYHRVAMYCWREDFRRGVSPEIQAAFDALDAAFDEIFFAVLQKGMAQGIFPSKPIKRLTYGPQAAFTGAVQLIWNGCLGDEDVNVFIEEITQFILVGLIYQDRDLG
jgi:AcrR family transcriptional regulator